MPHPSELPVHTHISADSRRPSLHLRELARYRDLIRLFTRRTFTVSYKQTILGPLWLFINPLLTCLVQVILFGRIAKLSTEGVPQLLFYLTGNALWVYFSSCVTETASTFTSNAHLFGKVWFPRMTVPVSRVLYALARFGIQMTLVLVLLIIYAIVGRVRPVLWVWLLLPLILAELGLLGMGIGVLISSLTTKYRDLSVLVGFGMHLWMYATPVVYPLSAVADGPIRALLLCNPVTPAMELFRYAVLGTGTILPLPGLISCVVTLAAAIGGMLLFDRVERCFTDTV